MTFLDRIKETSTSTGTGTFTLGGAVLGYKVFSNGTYKYCIVNDTESEWEVGEGTVASGVLTRTTIEASSNGGAIVSFSAGTKQVFNTVSAAYVNSLVPYTGATASVNLGEYGLTAGQLTLDTSPTGTAVVGTTRWNDTIGSSETLLKGGNVLLKDGVDLVARVVNKVTPATTLTKAAYKAVRVSGAQGQRLAVAYAQANNDNNSADTIGLVCETIAQNQEGFIITVGQLLDVNTTGSLQGETWADGDVLYLSPTTAGNLTNIKPNGSTGHIVIIGYVEYAHANNGKIYVKVMNGWELTELHDTYISSVANNDVLVYESSTTLWKNKSISTILGYTPADDSLVMKLAGSQTATGYKTFSIGLQTTTGDNYLNYTSGATYIGYSAAPVGSYKFAVSGTSFLSNKLTLDNGIFQKNLYTDLSAGVESARIGTAYELYGTLHASNGYTTYLTTTGFASGWDIILGNSTYKSLNVTYQFVRTNVDFRAGAGISNVTGNNAMSTYYSSPYEGFKPQTTNGWGFAIFNSANSPMMAVKNTGQFVLSGYTSTSVFTGTVAGLLGFDSSGNVITTSASGGGISGSGTAGQVTYWTGTSAVGGSADLTLDTTLGRLNLTKSVNGTAAYYVTNASTGSSAVASFSALNGTTTVSYGVNGTNTASYGALTANNGFFYSTRGIVFMADSAANGILQFASGGNTERMRLWNTGNVTIQNGGTFTDGGYRLDVNGTGASTGALRVTGGNVQFGSATGLNWDNTNGRLGIGTSSPTSKVSLSYSDNNYNEGFSIENTNTGTAAISYYVLKIQGAVAGGTAAYPSNYSVTVQQNSVQNFSTGNRRIGFVANSGGTGVSQDIYFSTFGTNATYQMIIKGDGKIGINNNTPTSWLDIPAATTSLASLRIRSGTAPTSPNDGDIWYDGTNIFIRVGGSTKTFTIV